MNQRETKSVEKVTDDQNLSSSFWTVPNIICLGRVVGSLVLLVIAFLGLRYWFVAVYVVSVLSDWFDGQYARRMNQQTSLGARLDTFADALLNSCLLIGVSILCWHEIQNELVLIAAALTTYLITCTTSLLKFGRVPAYHTYLAKLSQFLVLLAALSLILGWSVWPLRIAACTVILGNLETIGITLALQERKTDVLSLFEIWPERKDRDQSE